MHQSTKAVSILAVGTIDQSSQIDFLGKRKAAFIFSGNLFLISIISFFVKGMKPGI